MQPYQYWFTFVETITSKSWQKGNRAEISKYRAISRKISYRCLKLDTLELGHEIKYIHTCEKVKWMH